MKGDFKEVGKVTHCSAGWIVSEGTNISGERRVTCQPICRTCHNDLSLDGDRKLECMNPNCTKYQKGLALPESYISVKQSVVRQWEGKQRRQKGGNWFNFDQEIISLAESSDKDNKHWCLAKLLQTDKGKMVMVLVGRAGQKSKIQFFLKDDLAQITLDNIGDIDPRELLTSFAATFSDGTSVSSGKSASPSLDAI